MPLVPVARVRFHFCFTRLVFVVDRNIPTATQQKHVCLEIELNILDTAHAVAHDYPGGCESLAPRIGMSAAVLRSKVNPNTDTHQLTLMNAVAITDKTGDERILEAWATQRDMVLVKLPAASDEPDNEEILEKFLKLTMQYGELAKRHQEAVADGEVDDHEMADLERIGAAIHRSVEEINALTKRVYKRVPAARPVVKVA